MAVLPTGTVTFLFTDLEGSTRLWEQHPDGMRDALARHDEILRETVEKHAGHVVKTTGDGLHAAFPTAHDAVAAAVDAQRALATEPWPLPTPLLVRMGVHTGEAHLRDDDYYGTAVNRAARIASVAHGGQLLCSRATEELVRDASPPGFDFTDLGEHQLRDLARPEHVFQIRADGLRADFPPLRSLDAFPGNLPRRATLFVGREREVAKVSSALASARLVTLTGVGGVGKTRLALHVAAEVLPHYPDGSWFCELAPATDGDAMAEILAATLAVPARTGVGLTTSVVEYLRPKQLLLVLDNCEHLLDEAADFADAVLGACPDVHLLATSREGLAVDGEQVVPLRSLPLPDPGASLDDIGRSDAVRLFVDRALAVQADYRLESADAGAVAEICRRLDGVPLAIELAAARTVSLAPTEIAQYLDERFRLLTGGRRSSVERHQTLRATVDWSYSLLGDRDRAVFDRLGVFSGTFDGAAATAVVAADGIGHFDVLDALQSLVAKSMVVAERGDAGSTRYALLETLRQYARERLEEDSDPDEWRRRHALHYATLAEDVAPGLLGPAEIEWRRRLDAEYDNVRAAVAWALDRHDVEDRRIAFRAVAALTTESSMRRASGIGLWALRALDHLDEMSLSQRYDILSAAAWWFQQRAAMEGAIRHATDAIDLGVPPDSRQSSGPYICLATVWSMSSDLPAALAALADGREAVDGRADAEFAHAAFDAAEVILLASQGSGAQARTLATSVLDQAQRIGNPTLLVLAYQGYGWSLMETDPEAALSALEESVRIANLGALDGGLSAALSHVAVLRHASGDTARALDALRDAMVHCRDSGEPGSMVIALVGFLQLLTDLGATEAAHVAEGIVRAELFAPLSAGGRDLVRRHDEAVGALSGRIDAEVASAAIERGRAMSEDAAYRYLLAELALAREALRVPGDAGTRTTV